MNLGAIIRFHAEIVLKHWILVLVVALLVGAAGWYHHSSQAPLFEARTKLKIIRASTRTTSADVPFSFEEDQVFYNTQYNLLRTQLDWAEMAMDRAAWLVLDRLDLDWESDPASAGRRAAERIGPSLSAEDLARIGAPAAKADFVAVEGSREPTGGNTSLDDDSRAAVDFVVAFFSGERPGDGADPAGPAGGTKGALRLALDSVRSDLLEERWGYGADSFLASVEANPVPGTYLVELTFRAGERSLAVLFANLYSELYRDVSREERQEMLNREIESIRERQEKLDAEIGTALGDLETYKKSYTHLASSLRSNEPRRMADFVAEKINEIETERIARAPEEKSLRSVLDELGLALVEPEGLDGGGFSLALRTGANGGGDLQLHLVEHEGLLEHPVVGKNPSITQLRERLRGLERERFDLPRDLTDESAQVRRLLTLAGETRREIGRKVEATICRYFDEGRRRGETLEDLRARFDEKAKDAAKLDGEFTELARLEERLSTLKAEKESVVRAWEALSEVSAQQEGKAGADALNVQNIEIERRARYQDSRQIRPNSTLNGAVTVVLALLLSIGGAYLLEFLDDSIKTKVDLDRFVGLPEIGLVPSIGARDVVETAVLEMPRSAVAEACRSIRTAILFSRRDEEMKIIAITSATQGEGKTTVSVNLAVTMAQARRGKVLLIDADLRQARIHGVLGLENHVGLTNCLIGNATLAEAVQETKVPDLHVLTSGPIPPNPAELLGGHRLAQILAEAGATYAKVIVDTTPVVPVTDASLVAPLVDGVFLVVSAGKTSRRLVVRAQETLAALGVTVSGVILNCIRYTPRGYDFRYGYPSRDEPHADSGRAPK